MPFWLTSVIGFSLTIAMIIGWIRFKKINPAFFPFVYLLSAGFVSELLSFTLVQNHYSNAVVYNIYSLAEAVLIVWQFQRWQLGMLKRRAYAGLQTGLVLSWCLENFYFSALTSFGSYFILLYSFVIVILSVQNLNVLISHGRVNLLKNPVFLICVGFLLYFTYTILVEAFWMYGLNRDPEFQSRIFGILLVINLLVNLLYTLATLWIPIKPTFLLPS